jgi:LmbE family N-acetylglucosaminyl deacetylase
LPENWERALCVAAHRDDGIHPDEAGALREEEERLGAAEAGVETVQFLDYQDGVAEYALPLRRDIARAIRQYRPDVVISGPFTVRMFGGVPNQADHRVVGLATLDAARAPATGGSFPSCLTRASSPGRACATSASPGRNSPRMAWT